MNNWIEKLPNIKEELWKPLKGYEELYKISNSGFIKNRYNKIKSNTKNGFVTLCKDGKPKIFSTIILINENFVEGTEIFSFDKIDGEIWKSIGNSCYEVSNMGRVRSMYRGNNRILKSRKIGNYILVNLRVDNKNRNFLMHRLVAQAFIENPENKETVNHIDGNTENNCLYNLEWCTYSENQQHAIKTGLRKDIGQDSVNSKLREFQVYKIHELYKEGVSLEDISKLFKLHIQYARLVVNGKRWNHVFEALRSIDDYKIYIETGERIFYNHKKEKVVKYRNDPREYSNYMYNI